MMHEAINKLDFLQIKNFYSVKGNVRRMSRQATDIPYKGWLFKIDRALKTQNKGYLKAGQRPQQTPQQGRPTGGKKLHGKKDVPRHTTSGSGD